MSADIAESLSAVLPKVFTQLQDTMDIVDVGHVDSISMGIEGRMFTAVSIGRICLTAIHEKNKLTKAQLVLISRVAEEIIYGENLSNTILNLNLNLRPSLQNLSNSQKTP